MADDIISTRGLSRNFGGIHAVEDLTLDVPAGIIFGFLGPNGSGKTTTIRLLTGLIEPSAGAARVLGFDTMTQGEEIRSRTGSLLEHTGLYERLTAEENLDFYGRVFRLSAADRRQRIRELLEPLDLYERRGERVGGWSRGMKQKLAIARALLHRPALIFLDEPTAGLDPAAAVALQDELEALTRREGVTIFLTTHNLAEAEKLCALVGVIQAGRLLAAGSPDQLRARTGRPRLEILGSGFDAPLLTKLREQPGVTATSADGGRLVIELDAARSAAPLVRLIVGYGADVEEVRRGSSSLEEAFLELTGAAREGIRAA